MQPQDAPISRRSYLMHAATDSSSFVLASLRNPNCGPISLGIAPITTVSERRQQFHQTNVGSAIATSSQQFAVRTQALAD